MSRGRRRDVGATSARHGDKSSVKCLILGAFLLVSASHGRRGVAEIPTRSVDRSHARTPIKACSILRFTGMQGGPLQEQNTPNPLDTCACRAPEGFLGALGSLLAGEPPGWCLKESPSAQHAHVSKGFGVFCSFKAPPWIPGRRGLATGRRQEHLVAVLSTSRRRPWAAAHQVFCPDRLFFHYICAARSGIPSSGRRTDLMMSRGRQGIPPLRSFGHVCQHAHVSKGF